ncbi:MAG: hypothetical protein ACK53Y_11575, partial [bacterium]
QYIVTSLRDDAYALSGNVASITIVQFEYVGVAIFKFVEANGTVSFATKIENTTIIIEDRQ